MNAAEIIKRASSLGVRLAAKDGRLVVDAPKGMLSANLRTVLVEHKAALLRLLAANERPVPAVWSCRVDGAAFTVIDPDRETEVAMLEGLRQRFGGRFEKAVRLR